MDSFEHLEFALVGTLVKDLINSHKRLSGFKYIDTFKLKFSFGLEYICIYTL